MHDIEVPDAKWEEYYRTMAEVQTEMETSVRKKAKEVMTELEVDGDSWGVPTVEDIVENLVEEIKHLRTLCPKKD